MRITFIAIMTTLICITLASSAVAQDSTHQSSCHTIGTLGSLIAQLRNRGVPIAQVIDQLPGVSQQDQAQRAALDQLVITIYQSDVTPDDAYISFRRYCEQRRSASRPVK